MSRFHSYLNSTKEILQQYSGEEPFASSIKKFFAARKKYGSKDRKHIAHLCYCFFRMGKAVLNISLEEKILLALFLCSDQANEILHAMKPEWNEKVNLPLSEKLSFIHYPLLKENVFPWKEDLSAEIDFEKFISSFFIQPGLFLRLRPGKGNAVKQKLQQAEMKFEIINENCLALPNASKIETVLELDNEAVIQDLNSQQTGEIIKSEFKNQKPIVNWTEFSVWDCCGWYKARFGPPADR